MVGPYCSLPGSWDLIPDYAVVHSNYCSALDPPCSILAPLLGNRDTGTSCSTNVLSTPPQGEESNDRQIIRLTDVVCNTRHTLSALALNHLPRLVCDSSPTRLNRRVFDPFHGGKIVLILLHRHHPWDAVEGHSPQPKVCVVRDLHHGLEERLKVWCRCVVNVGDEVSGRKSILVGRRASCSCLSKASMWDLKVSVCEDKEWGPVAQGQYLPTHTPR